VYVVPELADQVQTRARKVIFKPLPKKASRKTLAMLALAAMLRDTQIVPLAALVESIRTEQNSAIAAEQLRAVELSKDLL
jgi:hypothetical protein